MSSKPTRIAILAEYFELVTRLAFSSTIKMEAVCSSDVSDQAKQLPRKKQAASRIMLVIYLDYSKPLRMEALRSSVLSMNIHQIIRRYVSEDFTIHV
jgi:hypothetical protein